jgi:uncharacterized protein
MPKTLEPLRTVPVLLLLVMLAGPALAQTEPTVRQVYEAVESGHLTEAQQMMDQVLRNHPRSAKAHYVAAQVYAKEGKLPQARQELNTAQRLEPGLPFAKPESVRDLTNELSRAQPTPTSPRRSAFPWAGGLLVLAALGMLLLVRRLSARSRNVYPQYAGSTPSSAMSSNTSGSSGGAGAANPGVSAGNAGPGTGSGIAGGLASGLAVGAGVVAGEQLARRFMNPDQRTGAVPADQGTSPQEASQQNPQLADANDDTGGKDFGVAGDDAGSDSWDDANDGGGSWEGGGDGGDFGGDFGGGDWG